MRSKAAFFRGVVANVVIVAVVGALFMLGVRSTAVTAGAGNKPIYKGDGDKVSLMINVYWGTEYLDGMLDTLAANGVKTTFFVGGMWVRDNEEQFMRIVNAGHEIGNHGFFHKDHDKISAERNREEISATHNLVKAVSGKEMELFAPPSGAFDDITLEIAKDLGYTTIMWSKDTVDWRDKDAKLIFTRATSGVEGGDLVLMHPTAATAAALDSIIKAIKEKGLTVAPVSEVISRTSLGGNSHEQGTRL